MVSLELKPGIVKKICTSASEAMLALSELLKLVAVAGLLWYGDLCDLVDVCRSFRLSLSPRLRQTRAEI